MAIFGGRRDIATFKKMSRELVEDVISQEVGYYKVMLNDTKSNMYGEAVNKYFIGPVLIPCLIERNDYSTVQTDFTIDTRRNVSFRFLKYHLEQANVVPEIGDVIMYNELYYETDNVNENQLILGKDSDYAYSQGLDKFGSSYSIVCVTHFASPDHLGITRQRL